jgi:predicted nucleotide-binding protein
MKMKQNVFVVHGHDHSARDELVEMIKSFELVPFVLSELVDSGATIIEKFERYAKRCEFAIILLTPDDKSADKLAKEDIFRARQNVIFEMGWFYAKLGRQKTLLLYKGDVELPSDVTGVLYKKFESSPVELKSILMSSLSAGGIRIPTA